MVVKPMEWLMRGKQDLIQAALKCRGRECLRTLPSAPIHTVERIIPVVFLSYIIFSP